jgi:pimeloyl-ACP methyl ester carboxylesterase
MIKTIIILHGWNGRSEKWLPVQRLLVQHGYSVHVPQLPGFVRDTDKPWNLDDYVQWVYQYTKLHRLTHITVIGHSNGGRIGIKLAIKFPTIVDKLILVASGGIRSSSSWRRKLLKVIAKSGSRLLDILRLGNGKRTVRKLFYRIIREPDYDKASQILKQTMINIIDEDISPLFKSITRPVTLIWGTEDKLTPPWTGKKMHEMITGSDIVWINGAGHGLPFTHPEKLIDLVIKEVPIN